MNTTDYQKLLTSLRYWLKGLAAHDARYFTSLHALEFFGELHAKEVRKDGTTKGFYHQLNILAFARTQHASIAEPYNLYPAILGHDGVEDYPEHAGRIATKFPEHNKFFVTLSKWREGNQIPKFQYFAENATCIVCSLAKAIDRIHNFSTMNGVFDLDKQRKYASEGREHFLPMLKRARRLFPEQEPVYELLKAVLLIQITATEQLCEALAKVNPCQS